MPYTDLLPDLREGLGVSAAYDASITRGITRCARFLLRNYNFRESVKRSAALPLAANVQSFALPADAGKVKAVRLRQPGGGTGTAAYIYQQLRRREEGSLPWLDGPKYYWIEGANVYLDTSVPVGQVGLEAEVWYQTNSPTTAETWLSSTYNDVLEHRAGYEMAPKLRKPEAMQLYNTLWSEDIVVLAQYLQELEFADLEMRMGEDLPRYQERYPSG